MLSNLIYKKNIKGEVNITVLAMILLALTVMTVSILNISFNESKKEDIEKIELSEKFNFSSLSKLCTNGSVDIIKDNIYKEYESKTGDNSYNKNIIYEKVCGK